METKTISIKKEFTEEELNDIAMQISEKIQAYYTLEEEKRRTTSSFNIDLKVIKTDIQKLVSDKTLGFCWEERTCEVENDYRSGIRSYLDLATGDVVKTEPIEGESGLFENISKVTASENDGLEKVIYQEQKTA